MKKCMYCFMEKEGLTKEHIIPAGLLELYPEQDTTFNTTSAGKKIYKDNEGANIKDVCDICNNNLLSSLDNYGISLIKKYFAEKYEENSKISVSYDFHILQRWLLKITYNMVRASNLKSDWYYDELDYILHNIQDRIPPTSIFGGLNVDMTAFGEEKALLLNPLSSYQPLYVFSRPRILENGSVFCMSRGLPLDDDVLKIKRAEHVFTIRFGSAMFLIILWDKNIYPYKIKEFNAFFQENYPYVLFSDDNTEAVLTRVTDGINCLQPGIIHSKKAMIDSDAVIKEQLGGRSVKETQDEWDKNWSDEKQREGRILLDMLAFPNIRSDLKEKVAEYTSLGKKPVKTIISKMETAKGLLLSSSMLLEDCIPNIVIIPDYEKTLLHDVNIVEEYQATDEKKDEEEKQYLLDREAELKRWDEVDKALKEAEEYKILTSHALKKLLQRSSMEIYTYKTRSRWHKDENRRVRPEEIEHPQRYTKYEDKYFPRYHRNQTEEVKVFNIKPYSVGLVVNSYKNFSCKINCFDGQGLTDISWMENISEKLGLNYTTQGIQLRLPYIKGFIVSFPIKQWASDHGVSKIKDIWGTEWDLFNDNIDMIITESCFKAKLEKSKEGLQQWLFTSMKDYYDSLEKYGFNKVGISSYVKSKYLKDLYTPITYQHIYAFNLNDKAIRAIVSKTGRLGLEIKNAKDISFTKAYLNMLISYKEDEIEADEDNLDTEGEMLEATDEEEYVNIIHKALDINHRMLFDPHIRSFLVNQARKLWRQLLLGRAYIKGGYIYATGDCIAFMEHTFGLEVKGFLRRKQLYCHGKIGEHILIRNPITHYSEVIKAHLIKSNDKYVRHLNNVVQFSAGYDLLMAQSNLDYDGDKLLVTNDPVLLGNKIEAPVIYNPGDKTTAEPMEYNLENILAYELMNLNNSTGRVTNINSTFCDRAMEKGEEELPSKDFEITICKHLQGLIIDSVKSMKKVDIPEVLENATRKKPYFLSHKYGDYKTKITSYKAKEKSNSPFNEFAKRLENSINSTFKTTYGDIIDINFLDIQNTKELLQDRSKCDTATFFDILEKLHPVYKEYIRGRDKLVYSSFLIYHIFKSDCS